MNLALLVLVWMAQASDGMPSCAVVARSLSKDLVASSMAMEPEGRRQAIYDQATEATSRCQDDEPLAYVRLRSAELAVGPMATDEIRKQTFMKLAQDLSKQFPKSVRIVTIAARSDGSVDGARRAVALDPNYAPAQVALAVALLDAGNTVEARTTIDGVKNLVALDDGFTALARVKWAQGDTKGAIAAANKELKGRAAFGVEPGAGDTQAIVRAHEVLGLAYVKIGKFDQAAPHLLAAQPISKAVQDVMNGAPPPLRRAIATARSTRKR